MAEFTKGDRVQLTADGRRTFPLMAKNGAVGTIATKPSKQCGTAIYTVAFDGRKTQVRLHESFIEMLQMPTDPAAAADHLGRLREMLADCESLAGNSVMDEQAASLRWAIARIEAADADSEG